MSIWLICPVFEQRFFFCFVDWKKNTSDLELRVMFYLEEIFRTEVLEAASQVTLRELLGGEWGERERERERVCVCRSQVT